MSSSPEKRVTRSQDLGMTLRSGSITRTRSRSSSAPRRPPKTKPVQMTPPTAKRRKRAPPASPKKKSSRATKLPAKAKKISPVTKKKRKVKKIKQVDEATSEAELEALEEEAVSLASVVGEESIAEEEEDAPWQPPIEFDITMEAYNADVFIHSASYNAMSRREVLDYVIPQLKRSVQSLSKKAEAE